MHRLAEVADGAENHRFIQRSFAGDPPGYLHREKNLCRAYAAECLAEAFLGTGRPQKRHSQKTFTYGSVGGWETVGGRRRWKTWAKHWGKFLRAGGDKHLGKWLPKSQAIHDLRPGDMIFWLAGVSGYKCKYGHVATVVKVRSDGTIIVSENSSSRGIGTHAISHQALAKLAGVMRWRDPAGEVPDEDGDLVKVVNLDNGKHTDQAQLIGDQVRTHIRALLTVMGIADEWDIITKHLKTQGKVYLRKVQ